VLNDQASPTPILAPRPISSPAGGKPRVLIAHPGRQHSHQAALALLEAGLLGCYASGVPVSPYQLSVPWRSLVRSLSLYEETDIPLQLTRLNMISPIANQLFGRHLPGIFGPILCETERIFDRWVSRLIERSPFDVVIAYENSALYTFQAAKKTGAKCILDAASLHHVEQDRHYESKLSSAYKARVDHLKDKEIALADCIFTTSDLAAQSYLGNVAGEKRVKVIPLGVDIDRFEPSADQYSDKSKFRPFTFIFVGKVTVNKGFDVILDAMERLLSEGLPVRLSVAGSIDHALLAGRRKIQENILDYGMVGHAELPSVLTSAHCLVLPSRFDSFGLVIPEAMACGVPVIVSNMVGAKQLVEEGRNGFVVPVGNLEALVDRMRWFVANPGSLRRMSIAARAAAERFGWPSYRQRFVTAVRDVVRGQ
jgi:glycosyltransferase involved in cell wall biosynthesis